MAVCAVTIILLVPRFFGKETLTAEISVDGKIIETIDLDSIEGIREFSLDVSPAVTVTAEKGRIRVSDAECPDRLCVGCGWLDSDGDMAVCLPAKTVISIKGAKSKNVPDAITY